ncbi:unnamed protein product [Spirodela intermedia]|nr:unnamed protein product [Spirodela intermedia]CAA6668781.1 unnamed protein product [Spirodela intermedia]
MGSDDEDSRCDSAWGSWPAFEWPERLLFQSEVEEEDGMIEIPLEEDNLIEIDISACR